MVIQPVVLSGGSGTRLWPLSREFYPKQLIPLIGELTLLQETVKRLDWQRMPEVSQPIIVCNEEHRFMVKEQLEQIYKPASIIILETEGRNTAPALTLAALASEESSKGRVLLVMPADHYISDPQAFHQAVIHGARLAKMGHIVTFGVVPTRPETGYGYIKKGAPLEHEDGENGAYNIASFTEKPDQQEARGLIKSGQYLWNSGIFMMQPDIWLNAIGRYRNDIATACRTAFTGGENDGIFYRVDKKAFSMCPSDSIDYAVMEHIIDGHGDSGISGIVVPLNAGWSDVGAWSALWEISPQDKEGNVTSGDVYIQGTRNTMLVADHRLVVGMGLENMIVIETADAVFVSNKERAQEVKDIVQRLKADGRSEYQTHRRVYRPWGSYEGLDEGARFQVKRIVVKPGAALSLQMHHHRAEHWIVVKGTARVTRGEEVFLLSENESTYIPIGMKHRLENPGKVSLELIEVQSGNYLGEDDIVRFDDVYGRAQFTEKSEPTR
jgi:mannose-1-phosphate guanylyltransferase/mannose-6-phosphate isomerase